MSALGRPWRRWETWLAISALFLVSGSLLPWDPVRRIIFAALAFAIIVLLLGLRFASALRSGDRPA